jgi:hypothetical protein
MKFSERLNIQPARSKIQSDSIDDALKNSLWTVIHETVLQLEDGEYAQTRVKFTSVCYSLWINFFKYPTDTLWKWDNGKVREEPFTKFLRKWYYAASWFEIYDLIDFFGKFEITNYIKNCNFFLERELSAYRFIDNQLVKISSEEEIESIDQALNIDAKFKPVIIHLKTALDHLSDRKSPDYRNSIKESISAIEALCKIITGDTKATLGNTLKALEKTHKVHNSLKIAFSALYGYTSDSSGIRHALSDSSQDITFDDAKFMLVSCSAFVNYLTAKLQ